MQKYTNKGSVPWHPKESRTPCKNALNDSTIASSISWWQGWHLFHCISPMSLQDGKKIFTDKQQLATGFACSSRTVSPDEQCYRLIRASCTQFHVPLGTQAFQLPQAASKQRSVPWCCRCGMFAAFTTAAIRLLRSIFIWAPPRTRPKFQHLCERRKIFQPVSRMRILEIHNAVVAVPADVTSLGCHCPPNMFYASDCFFDIFHMMMTKVWYCHGHDLCPASRDLLRCPAIVWLVLHTDASTRRCVLHTHTRFHTQTLLHTDALTHKRFYTQTLLHADAFYTRTHAFTHTRFYTQTLLHTDTCTETKASIAIFPQFLTSTVHFVRKGYDWPSKIAIFPQFLTSNVHFVRKGYDWPSNIVIFPQFLTSNVHFVRKECDWISKVAIFPQFLTSNVHFVRKGCDWQLKVAIFPQFLTSNVHFVRKGCAGHLKVAIFPQFLTSNVHFVRKGCAGHLKVAIFPQFLTSNVHFVRKGCARRFKVAIFPQFLTSNVHFVRKGCAGHLKVAIFPQFLTSNVHFVRKGCVSWRSGGTAPALREKIEEEREEICRCEGVKI